jgi:hypothetical protein
MARRADVVMCGTFISADRAERALCAGFFLSGTNAESHRVVGEAMQKGTVCGLFFGLFCECATEQFYAG